MYLTITLLLGSFFLTVVDQKFNSKILIHQYLPFWPKETGTFVPSTFANLYLNQNIHRHVWNKQPPQFFMAEAGNAFLNQLYISLDFRLLC